MLKTIASLLLAARGRPISSRASAATSSRCSARDAARTAAELAGRLAQSIAAKVGDLGIRASVGVASYPATDEDQLLAEADRRLYASKRENGAVRLKSVGGSEAARVLPAGRTAAG